MSFSEPSLVTHNRPLWLKTFLIAWFLTREYTKRMLFCDKVYISSEQYQVLYNDPISHMKVEYRSACFA